MLRSQPRRIHGLGQKRVFQLLESRRGTLWSALFMLHKRNKYRCKIEQFVITWNSFFLLCNNHARTVEKRKNNYYWWNNFQSGLVNTMCGNDVQTDPVSEASKKVWTSGCIEIIRSWAERNLYTIAGIALSIALSQLFVIYLAKTLEGQIELQKSRWHSWGWPQVTHRYTRQVTTNRSRRNSNESSANARMALLILFAIFLYILCILFIIRLIFYFKATFFAYLNGAAWRFRKANAL